MPETLQNILPSTEQQGEKRGLHCVEEEQSAARHRSWRIQPSQQGSDFLVVLTVFSPCFIVPILVFVLL